MNGIVGEAWFEVSCPRPRLATGWIDTGQVCTIMPKHWMPVYVVVLRRVGREGEGEGEEEVDEEEEIKKEKKRRQRKRQRRSAGG